MGSEFQTYPLSDSLITLKHKVDAIVENARLQSVSNVNASAVIAGIDGVIERGWKGLNGSQLRSLSPSDGFNIHMVAQDAIVTDLNNLAKKEASADPKKAAKLDEAVAKASSFNRIAQHCIRYAEHGQYDPAGSRKLADLPKEEAAKCKEEIKAIFSGKDISKGDVLAMLETRLPKEYASLKEQIARNSNIKEIGAAYLRGELDDNTIKTAKSFVDLRIEAYRETMIGEALYKYSAENNLNMFDVLREASRQKLKPIMEIAARAREKSVLIDQAVEEKPQLCMNDIIGLAISPMALTAPSKSPNLVPA